MRVQSLEESLGWSSALRNVERILNGWGHLGKEVKVAQGGGRSARNI